MSASRPALTALAPQLFHAFITLNAVPPCLIVIIGSPLFHLSQFLVFAFKLADTGKLSLGLDTEIGVFPDQGIVFVYCPQISVKDVRIPCLSDTSDIFVFL